MILVGRAYGTYDVEHQLHVGSTMLTLSQLRRVVSGLVLLPSAMSAQAASQSRDDMIPRELALALLNFGPGMGGASDIRVGRLPDDTPPDLIPPGLEVLGSTSQFDNWLIVLVAPHQPDSAIGRVEAHLLANGWTKPPAPRYPPMRGFVSADFNNGGYQQPDIVCRDDAFVMLSGTYRRSGGSIVRLAYNRGQRFSACRTRADTTAVYRGPFDDAPVPILRAPLGSVTKEGNNMGSGGPNMMSMGTRLGTRLKPAEVITHYDKQMREQGWTAGADGTVPFLSARTYRKTDDKSRSWTAILMSMTFADTTEQDVSLRMTRR